MAFTRSGVRSPSAPPTPDPPWNMGDSQMTGSAFDGAFRRKPWLCGVAAALVMLAPGVARAADDLADVKAALARNHAVAVKRLQDWIALPSIAAENRAPKEGADRMAQLARDAGFQHVE